MGIQFHAHLEIDKRVPENKNASASGCTDIRLFVQTADLSMCDDLVVPTNSGETKV